MKFKKNSKWNEMNELECLSILKKLEQENFPYGLQIKLCEELSKKSGLSVGSLSAKVSNYKSIANINNPSNASQATKEIYKKYKDYSIEELNNLIEGLKCGLKN